MPSAIRFLVLLFAIWPPCKLSRRGLQQVNFLLLSQVSFSGFPPSHARAKCCHIVLHPLTIIIKCLACVLELQKMDQSGFIGLVALQSACYDLILATTLCSLSCHHNPFHFPLTPVLSHSCISFCHCYLFRVHRLKAHPLAPLTPYWGTYSLLTLWLRTKDMQPLAPLTPYRGGAATWAPWPAHSAPLHSGNKRSPMLE